MKKGNLGPSLKLSLSPPDEVSLSKFLTQSGTFMDGDLLVNRDGVRVVSQSEVETPPLIQPLDNKLSIADFDAIKVIGKGSGGIVQLVQHKWTGQFFALKMIQMNIEESYRKQLATELKINLSSNCPYVVVCYLSFYDNGAIYLVLEYMDGGSLSDFLNKVKKIPEPFLVEISRQVLKGLWYLHHEKHIIHRDLKPSNLLINHRGEVKITGFGVSAILANTSGRANTFVGTYNYMSPERITGGSYDYKSDIWSLGLVLLECATGYFPYTPPQQEKEWVNVYELMETIVDQPPPRPPSDHFTPEFCSFIAACVQKDPKDRWSANELMKHPFITKFEGIEIDLASYIVFSEDDNDNKEDSSPSRPPFAKKITKEDVEAQIPEESIIHRVVNYPTNYINSLFAELESSGVSNFKEEAGDDNILPIPVLVGDVTTPLRPPASQETSSSSFSYNYQVFLSEHLKQTFADHLYTSLVKAGLHTFRGSDESERREKHKLKLQKVMQRSRISVIVISKNYAYSRRCLDELLMILEWGRSSSANIVFPIFYGVDPSDVMEQSREINDAVFYYVNDSINAKTGDEILTKRIQKIMNWKAVLEEVADLTGIVLQNEAAGSELTTIQDIVGFIGDGLMKNKLSVWCDRECHLMNSGLSMLPKNMTFPVLTKLFLQDNYDLSEIPLSFFVYMPTLQVLNMSRTSIKNLPPSISHLVQLRELLLRGCKLLMELPPEIQALENLEVFDLEGTELIYIPEEIKMLSKLECLVVSLTDCAEEYIQEINGNVDIVPRNFLSKLPKLKELSIFVDPCCKWWYTEVQAITEDLIFLEKLETIKLYFPAADLLQNFLQLPRVESQSLVNFRLIVGHHDQVIISRVPRVLQDSFEALENCLKYVNTEGNIDLVGKVLKHASAFFLDRHWTIDQLSRFKLEEMKKLRFCLLVECNKMKTVIGGGDRINHSEEPVLGLLQYLSIYYMKSLESILVGALPPGSLFYLQILDLHTCPKLSTIFNIGLLSNLVNLKELIVEDCPKVERIVSIESSVIKSGIEFLPNLEKISLLHLPGLVSIFNGLRVIPRLASIVVYNCPKLQSISLVEISRANMKVIKGENEWWEALEWKTEQDKDYFDNIFVPFRRDGLMNQLAKARDSHNNLSKIQSSNQKQDQLELTAFHKLV